MWIHLKYMFKKWLSRALPLCLLPSGLGVGPEDLEFNSFFMAMLFWKNTELGDIFNT